MDLCRILFICGNPTDNGEDHAYIGLRRQIWFTVERITRRVEALVNLIPEGESVACSTIRYREADRWMRNNQTRCLAIHPATNPTMTPKVNEMATA